MCAENKRLKMLDDYLDDYEFAFVLSKSQKSEGLLQEINAWLQSMKESGELQKLLDNRRYELGNVEPEVLPAGAAVVAKLNVGGRIISVISYDETYTDDSGKDQLFIPSGKCVLTAPAAGRTLYGAVSQIEQKDGAFHTYAGRRVPKYLSSAEGNSRTLTLTSCPLLIPNNKDCFIAAQVLG